MSMAPNTAPETVPRKKREFNKFLFTIVNQLTLDEFKKYTNFREMMEKALMRKEPSEQERLEYYIKLNFKQNIPIKKLWKKGGFVSLKLTNDFYDSDVARRVFHELYGVNQCEVSLAKINDEDYVCDTEIEEIESSSESSDLFEIDKIDLAEDVTNLPQRRIKYPRKLMKSNVVGPSGNETDSEDNQHSTSPDMLNEEVHGSSTEVEHSNNNVDNASANKEGPAIIISNILLPLLQTPLLDENVQISIPNMGTPSIQVRALSPATFNPSDNQSSPQILIPNQNVQASNLENCTDSFQSESVIIPTGSLESLISPTNIQRNFAAHISCIHEQFESYVAATPSSSWSLQHFWRGLDWERIYNINVDSSQDEVLQNQSPVVSQRFDEEINFQNISVIVCDIEIKQETSFEQPNASSSNMETIEVIQPSIAEKTTETCSSNMETNEVTQPSIAEKTTETCSIKVAMDEVGQASVVDKPTEICLTNEDVVQNNLISIISESNSDLFCDKKIKEEKIFDEPKESWSKDVEIIEVDNPTIEIMDVSTQDLINNLELDRSDGEEQQNFVRPFAIPPQIPQCFTKTKTATTLTNIPATFSSTNNKKRVYEPLNVVVESSKNIPAVALPNSDFSLQPDSPADNYEIEECTMSDSQIQRYDLLNKDNSIFLSSQSENYKLNTGKHRTSKAASSLSAQKRSATCVFQQNKRPRFSENNIIHELYWKILNLKICVLQPLSDNTIRLEIQMCNDFDKFYLTDQQSIKRLFDLRGKEWQHMINILKAINGYAYDNSILHSSSTQSSLFHRIMNCFVRSIPVFVKSRIYFKDFMGYLLEVAEQRPFEKKCVNSSIDSNILKKMIEFKKRDVNKTAW